MTRTLSALAIATILLIGSAVGVLGKAGGVAAIPLNPEQETGAVVSNGSGFFTYTINGSELCYTLEVRDLTMAPFGAHIHPGERNVAGPVAVGLQTPPSATSTVSGCITAVEGATGGALSTAELAAIGADPRSFYVNVHTTNWPGGEIRGQLK